MFASFSQSNGQSCTYPWQHMVEIVTVDGCSYEVDLCVCCALTFPGEIKVNSYRNIGPCSSSLTPEQITQQVFTQLMSPYSLWFNLCNSNLPPCKNSPPLVVKLYTPICWKLILFYQDKLDSTSNIYISVPCDDDAYCYEEHKYWEDKYGLKNHTLGNYMGFHFPAGCKKEGYEIIKPTSYEGEESECYLMHSRCNQ